ncbi:phosphatase PAP2 family protein [Desulfurococcus amylolyticus]|uniref:Phosphoesterase PA-phosphatase related protein n=1 Tax=Desulfurococcus amylolyticus DSM 16532 TaxID=768672 RepID=I3XSS7_DESAM|nr:phosphatase PAP2 family protein [Desulfurococcus amylolyticus]AFL67001.1 phosphoesterase PA-phosphatase related protein [Desulfurococcus amylolyticus DSM 16532]
MILLQGLSNRFKVLLDAVIAIALASTILLNNTGVWRTWSILGEEYIYLFTCILLYYIVDPYTGLYTVLAVIASGSLNLVMKYSFNTPRPPNPLVEAEGPGFPSGHAQISTSFWGTLTLKLGDKYLAVASALLVAGISLSRIYLRAHYIVDVAGGITAGLAIALIIHYLSSRLEPGSAFTTIGAAAIALSSTTLLLRQWEPTALGLTGIGIALVASSRRIKDVVETLNTMDMRHRIKALILVLITTGPLYLAARTGGVARIIFFTIIGLIIFNTPLILGTKTRSKNTNSGAAGI